MEPSVFSKGLSPRIFEGILGIGMNDGNFCKKYEWQITYDYCCGAFLIDFFGLNNF